MSRSRDADQTRANAAGAARLPGARALRLHALYRGKIQTMPKCPVGNLTDFALWYTPGVAAPARAIAEQPELADEHTNRGNSIAIVSDGSRVLGLGDIGPAAALPVMEGKALLFKYLGGVDATPVCLRVRSTDELVETVCRLEPTFGGINLEDISQPACFRVLERLRDALSIPVWHDDQQGSATALLAAFINALKVVGKRIETVRVAMIGMGAANVAAFRLLTAFGLDPAGVVACDSRGTLHNLRTDIERARDEFREKWHICQHTNPGAIRGGVREALRGADVAIAFSAPRPGLISRAAVRGMARDPIVFACANPEPEIWPWDAAQAGAAVVATGRSDFPNQLNNALCFPGVFRGVLDVQARTVTDEMAIAVARELAQIAERRGLGPTSILPRIDDSELHASVACAAAMAAQALGVARRRVGRKKLLARAEHMIDAARRATQVLMTESLIPPAPP